MRNRGALATGSCRQLSTSGYLTKPDDYALVFLVESAGNDPVAKASRFRIEWLRYLRLLLPNRRWQLWTFNIRTNHVHTVVSANCDPEIVLNTFKANATRKMREAGCWQSHGTPWVRKGNKRRLWTEQDLIAAIVYVECEQGEPLP